MHDAGIRAFGVFLGQNAGHVVIGAAGVDDQRQAGFAGRRDMNAQALALHLGAVGGVVVIEPGFTDADKLGCSASLTNSSTVARGSSAALIGWVPAA